MAANIWSHLPRPFDGPSNRCWWLSPRRTATSTRATVRCDQGARTGRIPATILQQGCCDAMECCVDGLPGRAGCFAGEQHQLTATPAVRLAPAGLAGSPEAGQVRAWYRDYLGREVGPELTAWLAALSGGMSPIDVQATILGSDEFFYRRARRAVVRPGNAASRDLGGAHGGRLRRWTDRLTQLRGDRFALAREILLTQQPAQSSTSQVGDLSTRPYRSRPPAC